MIKSLTTLYSKIDSITEELKLSEWSSQTQKLELLIWLNILTWIGTERGPRFKNASTNMSKVM